MSNNELAIQINHKAFELIQEFNNDPEKRLRLYDLIFDCSFTDKEINDEDGMIRLAAKSILSDIKECRNNYKEKCKKNAKFGILGKEYGIQGKEYGIQGKEYGILGKEYGILGKEYGILGKKYGKLGGRPRKRQKEFNEIYEYIVSDKENIRCAISKDKEDRKALYKEIKAIFSSVSENNEANNKLINSAINKVKEEKDIHYMAEKFACERKVKATKEELKVLEQIEELGIPNIEFQKPVFISNENREPYKFYIADFLDVDNKIDIEIDGGYHTSEEQRMKDEERERDFKKMGYDTLRITNEEVNSGKAIEKLRQFRDKNIL